MKISRFLAIAVMLAGLFFMLQGPRNAWAQDQDQDQHDRGHCSADNADNHTLRCGPTPVKRHNEGWKVRGRGNCITQPYQLRDVLASSHDAHGDRDRPNG